MSDLSRSRSNEILSVPDSPTFSGLLTVLGEQLTRIVHGESSVLLLYDDVADGFAVGAVCGSDFASLVNQAVAASEVEPLVRVLEQGEPTVVDVTVNWGARHTGASHVLAAQSCALIPLDDGTSVGVFVATATETVAATLATDTVRRAAREAAAAISLARPDRGHDCLFRRALESDPGGIAVVEGDEWVFSYASPIFREIHNVLDETFIGRTVAATLPPRHAHALLVHLNQMRETGISRYVGEVEIRDQYGPRFYDVHLLPQRDAEGKISAVLMIFWARTDAYVTRRALQSTILKLAESESLLAAVLNASNSGITFISMDGVVAYANRKIAEFFNVRADDLIGLSTEEMLSGHMTHRVRDPDSFAERLRTLYDDMEQTSTDEVEVEEPAHRILERYSAPVYADDGGLLGRIEVYNDVTEVRELQRNKDAFLSLVSHELRTPITSVKGYAQLLRRRARKEQLSETTMLAYETIERQTQRMQDLIDLLLDLTRLESGRLHLSFRDVNLTELARHSAEMVQLTVEGHEIEMRLPARAVWVRGDEHRLEQVLVNLLNNAVRYSPAGGAVTVAMDEIEGTARVTVIDRGVGIPADKLERIFERFYRAQGVSESTGLGLGLYITKEIIEKHGGSVRVDSTVGVGSTFTVVLPSAAPLPHAGSVEDR